jgi:ABC-type lipoprotein release transport system permease subunit
MNRQLLWISVLLMISLSVAHNVFGQSIMVGPDEKFEKQVLSLPYAFYNENYIYAKWHVLSCQMTSGCVSRPQAHSEEVTGNDYTV